MTRQRQHLRKVHTRQGMIPRIINKGVVRAKYHFATKVLGLKLDPRYIEYQEGALDKLSKTRRREDLPTLNPQSRTDDIARTLAALKKRGQPPMYGV